MALPIHRSLMVSVHINLRKPLFYAIHKSENCKESVKMYVIKRITWQNTNQWDTISCCVQYSTTPVRSRLSNSLTWFSIIHDWLCCSCTFRLWIPWHFYIIKCCLLYSKCLHPTVRGPIRKIDLFFILKMCQKKGEKAFYTKHIEVWTFLLRLQVSEMPFGWCCSIITHYIFVFCY
jgi:hypothetical protein